jgi:hypothetical protein
LFVPGKSIVKVVSANVGCTFLLVMTVRLVNAFRLSIPATDGLLS